MLAFTWSTCYKVCSIKKLIRINSTSYQHEVYCFNKTLTKRGWNKHNYQSKYHLYKIRAWLIFLPKNLIVLANKKVNKRKKIELHMLKTMVNRAPIRRAYIMLEAGFLLIPISDPLLAPHIIIIHYCVKTKKKGNITCFKWIICGKNEYKTMFS